MAKKDLFDDSTMTFGEHLEVLRVHLWKAIVGLVIGAIAAFFFSKEIIVYAQKPVVAAMDRVFIHPQDDVQTDAFQQIGDWWNRLRGKERPESETVKKEEPKDPAMFLRIPAEAVAASLHKLDPEHYPAAPDNAPESEIVFSLEGTAFWELIESMRYDSMKPRTDGPDEAFMIYMKVSLIVGAVIASPWIFYQLWLFIAAGLYPHERKYVYRYLPLAIFLFLAGAFFCFFVVIPYVLKFLFAFNKWLEIRPEIKISTWISFALLVSLMFGVSFQLPLVMLLLDRIGIVDRKFYREKWRYAYFIIATLSMVLTPSDPVSMMCMMIPLCVLYEFGILLCGRKGVARSPFEAQPA